MVSGKSTGSSPAGERIIDLHGKGIGDVVVACWLIHGARQAGKMLRINPRGRKDVCRLFSLEPEEITDRESVNWAKTDGLGHRREYAAVENGQPLSRFRSWAEALGMEDLAPVRPPYREMPEDGDWAAAEWERFGTPKQMRIAIFPETAWLIRQWPKAYFMDLATALKARDTAVVMVGRHKKAVADMGSRWYAGFSIGQTAALIKRADLVIGNDSGPAHIAGAIGTQTRVLGGPTDIDLVFAHDPNIRCLGIAPDTLTCHPCHYSPQRGYREACKVGGCRALMLLTPETVLDQLLREIGKYQAKSR